MLVFHKDKSNIHIFVIMNLKSFYIFATCAIIIVPLVTTDDSMKKDGFSEIYDVYFPKLLRFTQTYLISEDESENIVQEIFIYLWEHRDIIENTSELECLTVYIGKNRCIDYFRKEMVRDSP